jgi:Cellulase (glycosyl hydrolase family 5)/Glycoside hydrolase family 5 C-terminal domain
MEPATIVQAASSSSAASLADYSFAPGSARDLWKDGPWFRDKDGRYCLFRGVNLSSRSKRAPYLPIFPWSKTSFASQSEVTAELDRVQSALELLKTVGFNFVRLLFLWKGLTPTPEPLSEGSPGWEYLNALKLITDELYFKHGIFVLVDFHQDIAHDLYGGDGFPDWALGVDAVHGLPATIPAPDRHWSSRYYFDAATRNTLQSFWRNSTTNTGANLYGFATQDHLLQTMGATAKFFMQSTSSAPHPGVMGYEAFNEPTAAGVCDKDKFEEGYLLHFYQASLRSIRAADPHAFLFFEPRVDWNIFAAEPRCAEVWWPACHPFQIECFLPQIAAGNERLVFSFHHYDPDTVGKGEYGLPDFMADRRDDWAQIYPKLIEPAHTLNMVPFLTEFGGDHNWDAFPRVPSDIQPGRNQTQVYTDLQFQEIEANLLNSAIWVWELYYTQATGEGWNGEKFSLLNEQRELQQGMASVVGRPYPMRSSALPKLLFFDSTTAQGGIVLTGMPASAPTVIYIPKTFHYPSGFEVHASSADLKWDAANQLLYWKPESRDGDHQVIICAPGKLNRAVLPPASEGIATLAPVMFF